MALTQIKSSNIADGTVVAADIADDSITNADIKSELSNRFKYLGQFLSFKTTFL